MRNWFVLYGRTITPNKVRIFDWGFAPERIISLFEDSVVSLPDAFPVEKTIKIVIGLGNDHIELIDYDILDIA